ncbi:MAG: hypothetical protein R3E32_26275 [Chitinophagales bacterium]
MICRIVTLFVFLFSVLPVFSQNCGVSHENQLQWLPKYLKHLNNPNANLPSLSMAEHKVPIVFHLVARNNGVGRAKVETALTVLCELNELFAASNISFYLTPNGLNFINHDGIFTNSHFVVNQLAMQSERRDSALNIFVVNSVGGGNVVGLYDANKDWVLVQRSVFTEGNKTTAHEIGHFFSLLHPHFGWDGSAWNPAIHGNPAPIISPDGQTPTERMDGSNCEIAGDFLCDTAPDYNFGIGWQQSCNYDGMALSPDSIAVNPDESLIMSYFNDNCRQKFSAEQSVLMSLDLEDESRAYLHSNSIPNNDAVAFPIVLTTPSGTTQISSNSVAFEWESVANAAYYYVEYDRSSAFNLDPKGEVVTQNSVSIIHDWLPNLTYYWRIFAWNETSFCSPPSAVNTFSLDIVSSINSVLVNEPNWVRLIKSSDNYAIDYQLTEPQKMKFEIYSLTGKVCFSEIVDFSVGKGERSVNLPYLQQGIYIAAFHGQTTYTQRLLIY